MGLLTINKSEKRFDTFTGETVQGISFAITTNESTFNTAETANHKVTIWLTQGGEKVTRLFPEKMKLSDLINFKYANNYVRKTAQEAKKLFAIYFGTHFVLQKGQGLYVEVENGGSVTTSGATCTIDVETIPGIGLQEFIPVLEEVNLDSSQSEYRKDWGSNLYKIVDLGAAATRLLLKSDKLNMDVTANNFKLANINAWDYSASNTTSVYVDSPLPLNNVNVVLTYGSAATRTIYIERRFITPEIVDNYTRKNAEHFTENVQAIKATAKEDCNCQH